MVEFLIILATFGVLILFWYLSERIKLHKTELAIENICLRRQVSRLEEANSVQANQIRELKREPTNEELHERAMAAMCEMKKKLTSGEGIPFKIMEIEHTPDGPMTTVTDTMLKMTQDGEVVLE